MTHVIAPPVEVVNDLLALVRFLKSDPEKMLKDLTAATVKFNKAVKELADANSEAHEREEKLTKKEAGIDAKLAKLEEVKAQAEAAKQSHAEGDARLQEAYANLNSRIDEFERESAARRQELDTRQGQLDALIAAAEQDRAEAARVVNEANTKVAAMKAALGG